MMTKPMISGLLALSVLLSAPQADAQEAEEPSVVARQTDWLVYVGEEPTKACWGVSTPKETLNTKDGRVVAVRRGDILLFVTYRPGESVAGEISFTGGYPFAEGSTVSLQIDEATYELFTEGEWAWPATPGDDTKIATSMKRGTNAVLTARSKRGTLTKDTFSLLGFTAAMEDAEARCAN